MVATTATDEIVQFLISENPNRVLKFKVSDKTKKRVFSLIDKSKHNKLSEKEKVELDQYLLLEHIMRLAKIQAYQILHS